MQKSRKWQEMALLMFWLLDGSSAVKSKTVRSCNELQPVLQLFRNLDFCLLNVLRFMAFGVTL